MESVSKVAQDWKFYELIVEKITGKFLAEMSQIKDIYRPVCVC